MKTEHELGQSAYDLATRLEPPTSIDEVNYLRRIRKLVAAYLDGYSIGLADGQKLANKIFNQHKKHDEIE